MTEAEIERRIAEFDSRDDKTRERARHDLVEAGKPAIPFLCKALESSERRVQWEAAKALHSLSDPSSAPALVRALEDNDLDVRWIAAEALCGLGRTGLLALLDRLQESNDTHLQDNARHILRRADPRYADAVAPVLDALRKAAADESGMVAAYEARQALKQLA